MRKCKLHAKRWDIIFKFTNKKHVQPILFAFLVPLTYFKRCFAVPNKMDLYCAICGKCCKQNLNSTRNILPQSALLENCFGVSHDGTGILCSLVISKIFVAVVTKWTNTGI